MAENDIKEIAFVTEDGKEVPLAPENPIDEGIVVPDIAVD